MVQLVLWGRVDLQSPRRFCWSVAAKRRSILLWVGESLACFVVCFVYFFVGILRHFSSLPPPSGISRGLNATMALQLEKDETGEILDDRLYHRIVEAYQKGSLLLLYYGEKPILFQPAGETQGWCGWTTRKNQQRIQCEKRVRLMIAGSFILLIIAGMILWYVYLNKKPDWIPLVSVRLLNGKDVAHWACIFGLLRRKHGECFRINRKYKALRDTRVGLLDMNPFYITHCMQIIDENAENEWCLRLFCNGMAGSSRFGCHLSGAPSWCQVELSASAGCHQRGDILRLSRWQETQPFPHEHCLDWIHPVDHWLCGGSSHCLLLVHRFCWSMFWTKSEGWLRLADQSTGSSDRKDLLATEAGIYAMYMVYFKKLMFLGMKWILWIVIISRVIYRKMDLRCSYSWLSKWNDKAKRMVLLVFSRERTSSPLEVAIAITRWTPVPSKS